MPNNWGETNFQPRENHRSGPKAKDGEKRKRPNDGNNNGQATHEASKPPGPISPVYFLHLTASVQSRPPGPTLVPRVLRTLKQHTFTTCHLSYMTF